MGIVNVTIDTNREKLTRTPAILFPTRTVNYTLHSFTAVQRSSGCCWSKTCSSYRKMKLSEERQEVVCAVGCDGENVSRWRLMHIGSGRLWQCSLQASHTELHSLRHFCCFAHPTIYVFLYVWIGVLYRIKTYKELCTRRFLGWFSWMASYTGDLLFSGKS